MAYLAIHYQDRPRLRKALDGTLTLGRAADCDLVLDDHRLSRQHCRFERDLTSGRWKVIDLASTNGTIVGGQRISTHALVDSDEIEIGRVRIVFHEGAIPPRRPADPSESQFGMRAQGTTSPHDTLLDSRVGVPGVARPSPKPKMVEDAKSRETTGTKVPLPFQRPPAQPIVPEDRKPGLPGLRWLRDLFRTSDKES